jgi:DNA-directed RNA polymerase specialized sigma subunit
MGKPLKRHYRDFEANQHLVAPMVRRLGGIWKAKLAGCEMEDLIQAGMIGLWRAVLRHNPKLGIKIATSARKAIVGEVLEALDKARYGVRPRKWCHPKFDHSKLKRLPDEL